jgi:hypothetical protein
MTSRHMGLWLDVYTRGTKLVQFVGKTSPFGIRCNWVRLFMKDPDIGCQEATHIKKIGI